MPIRAALIVVAVLALAGGVFAQVTAVDPAALGGARQVEPLCEDGVVKDDGSPETGYGWVPSVLEGIFVQEFHVSELPGSGLETVCICWMRSRQDSEISFDVVIYGDDDGVPRMAPAYVIPAVASDVPEALDGAFYEIDLSESDVLVGDGTFYVGARWDATVDRYFFICADHSDGMPVVDGYFIDDRADEWQSVLETSDPIFDDHRAMMIRVVGAEPAAVVVPTLSDGGSVVFALLLATLAIVLLRRGVP